MVRYCSNFKCKLWVTLSIDEHLDKDLVRNTSTKTAIVGRCTCCGAASGDCLRCGGV